MTSLIKEAQNGGHDPLLETRGAPAVATLLQRTNGAPARPGATMNGAFETFLLGVATELGFDESKLEIWKEKVATTKSQIEWAEADADAIATAALDRLKSEFVARVVAPKRYSALLRLWLMTLAAMLGVELVIGSAGILFWCTGQKWPGEPACGSLYGHFVGYIAFRYALYGVLIGNALRLSYSRARAAFDGPQAEANLLNRPVLNVILGLTVAYLLANLVACGKLDFAVLGFNMAKDFDPSGNQGFRDAAALLLVGLTASIASDVYIQRLIEGARQSANGFLQKKVTPQA